MLQGLRENGDVGSEVGSKTNRPCTSEARSRGGEASLVAGSPGRLQSRLAGSERETEALRAAVVVGSLVLVYESMYLNPLIKVCQALNRLVLSVFTL